MDFNLRGKVMGFLDSVGDFLGSNVGGALIDVGGSLASSYLGGQSAQEAAQIQANALAQGQAVSEEAKQRAREDILATAEPGLEDLISGFQGAIQVLEQPGEAEQREMALSGVLGPEAQQAAMDDFIASPGQEFLRQQQEQALLRNAGAIGGLGGGRVREALQEQAFGRAATQQQQQLQNISQLRGVEQQRQANIANILSSSGGQLSGYRSGLGSNLANISLGAAAQQIPLIYGTGQAQAAGQLGAGYAQQQAASSIGRTLGELF